MAEWIIDNQIEDFAVEGPIVVQPPSLPLVAGIYIFAVKSGKGWAPIHIGQAISLGDRVCASHEKLDPILSSFSEVYVHYRPVDGRSLDRIEADMIDHYCPPLDVHHVDDTGYWTLNFGGRVSRELDDAAIRAKRLLKR